MRWTEDFVGKIVVGDCREVLNDIPDNSIAAVVTDPPYELSNDRKTSPERVFIEVMFPNMADFKSKASTKNELSTFIFKILGLYGIGGVPRPSATMEIGTVALDGKTTIGDKNINDGDESATLPTDNKGRKDSKSKSSEHLGDFFLEFTDASTVLDSFRRAGCCFYSGGFGIGFRISTPSLPSLLSGCTAVIDGDHPAGSINNALSSFISASGATENEAMPTFNMGGNSDNSMSACSALKFFTTLALSGSKIIRATPRTGDLPSKLQTVRISVIGQTADQTFSFNLITHAFSIAGRGFMNKEWDGSKIAFDVGMWREVLRVLKPGGHLVSFGGTRTYHRMACAIEDAGFEIRDQLQWLYGSGFPKSLDVSKAIDKAAGAERPRIGDNPNIVGRRKRDNIVDYGGDHTDSSITASNTDEAKQWSGWGTALKPANEPICLARKPLSEPTVAANVLKWGTGALNIDACRIDAPDHPGVHKSFSNDLHEGYQRPWRDGGKPKYKQTPKGRWPANVILDEEAGKRLDQQSGGLVSGANPTSRGSDKFRNDYGEFKGQRECIQHRGLDSGGASRFFFRADWDNGDNLLLCRAKAILSEWEKEIANTVDDTSSLSGSRAASVLSLAVTRASRGARRLSGLVGLSTSVTPRLLRSLCESVIALTLSIEGGSSSVSCHIATVRSKRSPAKYAEQEKPTDTTTTTISPTISDGCAVVAILSTTQGNTVAGDRDSASRFNYCAKTSRAERNEGLAGDPKRALNWSSGTKNPGSFQAEGTDKSSQNFHPTVKPVSLMKWLVQLVTPPGGIVLDPFSGSGSTLLACAFLNVRCVGIEISAEYAALARKRIANEVAQEKFNL